MLLSNNLLATYYPEKTIIKQPIVANEERVSNDHQELISWLNFNKYNLVRTNYWIGYRLAFETKEEIKFLIFDDPQQIRIPEYQSRFAEQEDLPMVLVKTQADLVRNALDILGLSYKVINLSNYYVIYDIQGRHQKLQLVDNSLIFKISSNYNQNDLINIFDQNLETRWGSASPQNSEMYVELYLSEPIKIKALTYNLGKWHTDFPRGLEIDLIDQNDTVLKVFSQNDYQQIRYFLHSDSNHKFTINLDPQEIKQIILKQTGSDSFFDWSIAEIELWQ